MKKEDIINLSGFTKISKQTGRVVLVLIDKEVAAHAEVGKKDLANEGVCKVVINSLIKTCNEKISKILVD